MLLPPPAATRAPQRPSPLDDYVTYKRLLYRGYMLRLRIALLQCVLWGVSPIATPMIIWTIRRWFDRVASDTRSLNAAVRGLRASVEADELARASPVVAFQNPWT